MRLIRIAIQQAGRKRMTAFRIHQKSENFDRFGVRRLRRRTQAKANSENKNKQTHPFNLIGANAKLNREIRRLPTKKIENRSVDKTSLRPDIEQF